MKISSFFLSTASADLFVPQQGTAPVSLNFADAEQYCQNNFGGHLANPANYQIQQLLDATHGLPAWIGIYRSSAQNKFFTISTAASFQQLVDETQPDWVWASGEPNNAAGQEYCVHLLGDGSLNDNNCFGSIPFLCEGTYQRSRSGASIVDAESATIIRENQEFENQQIRYNNFLDEAIQRTDELSTRHAHLLRNFVRITNLKIQLSDRELCGESLYVEHRFDNEFYYWDLSRTPISDHDDVCDIFRDFHDGIIHYIHEFGCTTNYEEDLKDIKDINRKFAKFLPIFCPNGPTVIQKPVGIDF